MHFNKTCYLKANYLLHCDYINKYNLETIYKAPQIENITFCSSIENLFSTYENKHVTENDADIQIRTYLLFYLLKNVVPYVSSNKQKDKHILDTTDMKNNFSLKVQVSNKKDIYLSLFSLLLENSTHPFFENIFKKILVNKTGSLLTQTFTFKAPIFYLSEFSNLLEQNLLEINTKDCEIQISLKITFSKENLNYINAVKNLPFFWTIN